MVPSCWFIHGVRAMSWARRLFHGMTALAIGAGLVTSASAGTGALPDTLSGLGTAWSEPTAGMWEGKTAAKDSLVVRRLLADAALDDGAAAKAAVPTGATLLADPGVPGDATWLFAVPQAPSGITYIGIRRLAVATDRWQIEVTCRESGTTGVREAVLLDRALGDGSVTFSNGGIVWKVPPGDPRYDAEFPTHPLSRCRKVLLQAAAGG